MAEPQMIEVDLMNNARFDRAEASKNGVWLRIRDTDGAEGFLTVNVLRAIVDACAKLEDAAYRAKHFKESP